MKLDNDFIIASLKSKSNCKLINRIPGLRLLISRYQARLQECMSTSVLEALPGKLDTKRPDSSIEHHVK